ncbi:MAG: WYL domain-containing protein [Syntrophaceae bacterium]|nr:WYL domain-containing protein [Syntrophaceae bacterium]
MPKKRDMDKSYGEKVIRLFAGLLFSGRPRSLTELANAMNCSKQTILRILADIESSYQVQVDRTTRGREAIFRIKAQKPPPAAYLTPNEMDLLWMCHAFTERLLGKKMFDEAKDALDKSRTLLKDPGYIYDSNFACLFSGSIDYTRHQETITTLIKAMSDKSLCKVVYKSPWNPKPKTFYIKPLKIFSYKEALYLHALRAKDPWQKKYVEPEFDPVLAIHRFEKVEIDNTKAHFEVPKEYDFQKAFNQTFGIIKDEKFVVEAEFTGWAAVYVEERVWSPDQELTRDGDKVRIRFTASSEPEIVAWILSFGEEGRLVGPIDLVRKVVEMVNEMKLLYEELSKTV